MAITRPLRFFLIALIVSSPMVVVMMMSMFRLLFPLRPLLRPLNLLSLLLDQEVAHGILIFTLTLGHCQHFLQLPLFLQQRPPPLPPLFSLVTLLRLIPTLTPISTILQRLQALQSPRVRMLIVPDFISRMIDPQHSPQHLGAPQIIHGEVTAALVLVFQEREPLAFARLLVAHQLQMCRVAVLREDDRDVAFRQPVVQPPNVDVCRVTVVGVPGRRHRRGVLEFALVQRLRRADGVHGGGDGGVRWVGGG